MQEASVAWTVTIPLHLSKFVHKLEGFSNLKVPPFFLFFLNKSHCVVLAGLQKTHLSASTVLGLQCIPCPSQSTSLSASPLGVGLLSQVSGNTQQPWDTLCLSKQKRALTLVLFGRGRNTTELHGAAPMSKNYVAHTNGSGKMESLPVSLYIMSRFLRCTVWREIVGIV